MKQCTYLDLVHTHTDILETPHFLTRIRVDLALDPYEERFQREKVGSQ